jgi:hypothetical protein
MKTSNSIKQNKSNFQFIHLALQPMRKCKWKKKRWNQQLAVIFFSHEPNREARERWVLFGEDRDDLEEDELKEVAGEGEDDAEDDLNQDALLFVLLVEPVVQEPQPRPSQQAQRPQYDDALVDRPSPPHLSKLNPLSLSLFLFLIWIVFLFTE